MASFADKRIIEAMAKGSTTRDALAITLGITPGKVLWRLKQLKKLGYVANSSQGLWGLTEKGKVEAGKEEDDQLDEGLEYFEGIDLGYTNSYGPDMRDEPKVGERWILRIRRGSPHVKVVEVIEEGVCYLVRYDKGKEEEVDLDCFTTNLTEVETMAKAKKPNQAKPNQARAKKGAYKTKPKGKPARECEKCSFWYHPRAKECAQCGAKNPTTSKPKAPSKAAQTRAKVREAGQKAAQEGLQKGREEEYALMKFALKMGSVDEATALLGILGPLSDCTVGEVVAKLQALRG